MKNNVIRIVLIVIVAVVVVVGAFGGGVITGNFINILKPASTNTLPATNGTPQGGTPADLQSQFGPFWQAWDLVHKYYVEQPVDNIKLVQGAISGMMNALGDPHSGYWTPQQTTDANTSMSGAYDGIGAFVDTKGTYLTITKPLPGYPAAQAGLQIGDQIIAVDGVDVTGMDPDLVRMTRVMGPAGTSVQLSIQRTGVTAPLQFTITRAHIVIPSVTSKILDNNIAYIQITVFGDTTADDFKTQLSALLAKNPAGLILDLRDNGGGLLDAGISVASQFIDHGLIVTEKYGDGTTTPHDALSGGLATSIPLVVLVNENTASASEIVSGAIQDDARGKLVGVTTYGKGSVQNWIPLSDGGTARITIAHWLTPLGRTIEKKGLIPDIVVAMTQADITAGKDPQLDAAVQALLHP